MKRLLLLACVAGLSVSATVLVTSAAGSASRPTPVPANANGAHAAKALAATPLDSATETRYTPITPCRAANTSAAGGKLGNDVTRVFAIGGSGSLAGQGGSSSGCGVPAQATAITATVTTSASAKGYLKAWAAGASEPGTAFMNYTNSFLTSSGGVVPLGTGGKINVKNHAGPTQLYIDVTGYYIKPMFAFVNGSSGTLGTSSRATGATRGSTGIYEVDFDRDVSTCAYSVTAYNGGVTVLAEPRVTNVDGVFVEILDSSSKTVLDSSFYVTVTC